MKIDGACHCGAITYRANVDPAKVAICHCTDCQKLSGTAFRTVVQIPDADFELLTGTPKTYVKIAQSGNKRAQTFCGTCGSPLWATSVGDGPKVLGLRLGTVRQRAELKPQVQIFSDEAMGWLGDIADIPAFKAEPPAAK